MTTESLYAICNRNKYFTCGNNTQYEKMFELNRMTSEKLREDDAKLNAIVTIIWLCSDDIPFEDIKRELLRAEREEG